MQTRQQSKEKSKATPLKVGNTTFRQPIGFDNLKKNQCADEDVRNEDYENDDDDDAQSENEHLSDEDSVRRRGYGWNVKSKTKISYISESATRKPEAAVVSSDQKNYWIYVVICVVGIIIGGIYYSKKREEEPLPFVVNEPNLSLKDLKLEEHLDNIRERFPSQDDSVWYKFGAGIKSITVQKPNKPSVFLMLYENNDKTPTCLANKVSKLAISYITGVNTSPEMVDGVELKEDKLLNKDSGELIVRYNETVRRKGSLIVTNLHEVPGNIAKSFHFFCDSYSPLIERAAYFFTLSTQGERLLKNNLQRIAEKTIRNLWSDTLGDHQLDPLITRLTGYVIGVVPESNMDSCYV